MMLIAEKIWNNNKIIGPANNTNKITFFVFKVFVTKLKYSLKKSCIIKGLCFCKQSDSAVFALQKLSEF